MDERGLRVLSLDGADYRGLSILFVLRELMGKINHDTPPKPCNKFDVICGTRSGGLIALMLGRLQMSIEECLAAYQELDSRLISSDEWCRGAPSSQAQQSTTTFESFWKALIVSRGLPPDAPLIDSSIRCLTVASAVANDGLSIQNFSSWIPKQQAHRSPIDATIWEAARATSATSTELDPITIGGHIFGGKDYGPNNLAFESCGEVLQLRSDSESETKVSFLMSIRAGASYALNGSQKSLQAPEKIGTNLQLTDRTFAARCLPLLCHEHYGFNICDCLETVGFDEVNYVSEIYATVKTYLESPEQGEIVKYLVDKLKGSVETTTYSQRAFSPGAESDTDVGEQQQLDVATKALEKATKIIAHIKSSTGRVDNQGYDTIASNVRTSVFFVDDFIARLIHYVEFSGIPPSALSNIRTPAFRTDILRAVKCYASNLANASTTSSNTVVARLVEKQSENISYLLFLRIRSIFEENDHRGSSSTFKKRKIAGGRSNIALDPWNEVRDDTRHHMQIETDDGLARVIVSYTSYQPSPALWNEDKGCSNEEDDNDERDGEGGDKVPQSGYTWKFLSSGEHFSRLCSRLTYAVHDCPLHGAILDDDLSMLQKLLNNHVSIGTADERGISINGRTLLDIALIHSGMDIITLLLEKYREFSELSAIEIAWTRMHSTISLFAAYSTKLRLDSFMCDTWEKYIMLSRYSRLEPSDDFVDTSYFKSDVLIFDWELPKVVSGIECSNGMKPVPRRTQNRNIQIMRQQVYALDSIVTITGSGTEYEAATCGEYMSKHFGDVGQLALNLVKRALLCINKVGKLYFPPVISIPFWASENHLIIHCHNGKFAGFYRFKKALIWLCQALRMAQDEVSGDLWASAPGSPVYSMTPFGLARVRTLQPLVHLEEDSLGTKGCWTNLFGAAVVAQQQISRPWGRGLGLSFDLMIRLADVHNYLWVQNAPRDQDRVEEVEGGFIMIGFFTALIPIARSPDGTEIQWHLECTGDRLINAQMLHSVKTSWLRVEQAMSLKTSTCYLGWCELAHVLLGTDKLDYKPCWTSLTKRSQTLHRKGYSAVAQGGINVGPIQVVGQGGPIWEFVNNRQRFNAPDSYAKALSVAKLQVALVYDNTSKRAWLVPKLSLILHLCHIKFRISAGNTCLDPIPFAQPSCDGSNAASLALYGKGDLEVFRHGSEDIDVIRLRNVLIDISANLSNAADIREDPRRSLLFGTELMDMLTEPGAGSDLREVPLNDCAKCWIYLARLVDCVGVCADLGAAIEPVYTSANCDCKVVQPGQLYLTAHLRCLEVLLQQRQHQIKELRNSIVKFGEEQEWCFKPYSPCPHQTQASYWDQPKNFLQSISSRNFSFFSRKEPPNLAEAPSLSGAVIFGQPPPRRIRRN